jgi:hypothetical protein
LAKYGFAPLERGHSYGIADFISADRRELALLCILIATGEKTIEAFQASANPVDEEFLADLERIIERSRQEFAVLTNTKSLGAA